MKPDTLIDQALTRRDEGCRSGLHRQPEPAQAVLKRARERIQLGEYINASALRRVIEKEIEGFDWSLAMVAKYLKEGCRCD